MLVRIPVESRSRSIAKAFTYRILGSALTGIIVLVMTHRPLASAGAGLADMVLKIGAYFLHERIWAHIPFGRERSPDYEI
jgi:uncharacterized membrane protein